MHRSTFLASALLGLALTGSAQALPGAPSMTSSQAPQQALVAVHQLQGEGHLVKQVAFGANGSWAVLYDDAGFTVQGDSALSAELTTLAAAGDSLDALAFTPIGSAVVLYAGDKSWAEEPADLPQDLVDRLAADEGVTPAVQHTGLALLPGGGWVLLGGPDGAGASWAHVSNLSLAGKLDELNHLKMHFKAIAVDATASNWTLLWEPAAWVGNVPAPLRTTLTNILNHGLAARSVAFAPGSGWVVLYGPLGL